MFPRALRREILLLVAAKAAVLALIYALFFVPSPGSLSLQTHLLGDRTP
jgi:hypothetical protein